MWLHDYAAYAKFVVGLNTLQRTWDTLQNAVGVDEVTGIIEQLFDSKSPQLALKAQAEAINRMKQGRTLGVGRSGRLTSLSTPGSILDHPGRHFGG